jgi:hypothetical protein
MASDLPLLREKSTMFYAKNVFHFLLPTHVSQSSLFHFQQLWQHPKRQRWWIWKLCCRIQWLPVKRNKIKRLRRRRCVRRCVVVAVAVVCFPKEFVVPIPSWIQYKILKEMLLGFGLGLSRFMAKDTLFRVRATSMDSQIF